MKILSCNVFDLDSVDISLLNILKKDARTPFTSIASELGVSDSTIHVRIKKLIDNGILRGYTVDLNEDLIEQQLQGLVTVNVNLGHIEEVAKTLIQHENVIKVFETHGADDLILLIKEKDLSALRDLVLEIRQIDHIISTSITPILKKWK